MDTPYRHPARLKTMEEDGGFWEVLGFLEDKCVFTRCFMVFLCVSADFSGVWANLGLSGVTVNLSYRHFKQILVWVSLLFTVKRCSVLIALM